MIIIDRYCLFISCGTVKCDARLLMVARQNYTLGLTSQLHQSQR